MFSPLDRHFDGHIGIDTFWLKINKRTCLLTRQYVRLIDEMTNGGIVYERCNRSWLSNTLHAALPTC